MTSLNVGVIGVGRIGRLHAEHLHSRIPGARLVAIADVDVEAVRSCAEQWQIEDWSTDPGVMLLRKDLDAVVICSSTDTHAPLIEASAAAGKHIFCEKPIDADLGRIDRALSAVSRAGVLLQVGFNRRFDPNFRRIKQAIAKGEIGTPHQVRITSRDPAPPPIEYVRKSGGLFFDMTIHDFDMARFLIGSEVEEMYAAGAVRVDPAIGDAGDLDTAVIMLKFVNGVMGMIENCRQAVYGYDQRVEVFGSGGSIQAENNYPNTTWISSKTAVQRDLPLHFFMDRYTESYLQEMREFVQAVQTGGASPVPGSEGRVPVVMAKAARRSWEQNRPVRLAEIG